MRWKYCVAALALMGLSQNSSQAQPSKNPEQLRRELRDVERRQAEANEQLFGLARAKLADFEAEHPKSCSSKNLRKASAFAHQVLRAAATDSRLASLIPRAGSELLDVADAAKKAGCKPFAREMYDFVIKAFISPMDAALRQRAQIGIDDMRH